MMNERATRVLPLLVAALAAVTLIAVNSRLASAHGNPEIVVTPNPAPAGATIEIEGDDFEEDTEVSLTLQGIGGDIALGTATTDLEGAFHVEVTLPDSATPGSYRIKAQAEDASALVDFRISAGADETQATAEHERSIGFHIESPTRQVIALLALAGVLAVVGAGLLAVRERETPVDR